MDPSELTYHSNLAAVYFEMKQYEQVKMIDRPCIFARFCVMALIANIKCFKRVLTFKKLGWSFVVTCSVIC